MARQPKYTKEYCKSVAGPYKDLTTFRKEKQIIYRFIIHHGWESECLSHMRKSHLGSMSIVECTKVARLYSTEEELLAANINVYRRIIQSAWQPTCFRHMRKKNRTIEDCTMIAQRYKTLHELLASKDRGIAYYVDKNKWRDVCFAHFVKGIKYSLEECMRVCMQYKTNKELREDNTKMYRYILNHGFKDVCFEHFDDIKNNINTEKYDGDTQRLTYRFRVINRPDLDALMRISKDIYNQTIYTFRSTLSDFDVWLSFIDLRDIIKTTKNLQGEVNFDLMPNQNLAEGVVLRTSVVINNYKQSLWRYVNGLLKHEPKPPGYLPRDGRFILALGKTKSRIIRGELSIASSVKRIPIPNFESIRERMVGFAGAEIAPCKDGGCYVSIHYDRPIKQGNAIDTNLYSAIDLGIGNLVTMVGLRSTVIYHGRFLAAYNGKYLADMRRLRDKAKSQGIDGYTKRMTRLELKHKDYVRDVMHKISTQIVERLVRDNVGNLVIGYNKGWKQCSGIYTKFLLIPHLQLIEYIEYKCRIAGINFIRQEESYTSVCDALALEPVCKHDIYLGQRIHRGLFSSSTGRMVNADVNGAINILRKAIGDAPLVREIIGKGHLFCPVGYKTPFGVCTSD